MTVGSPSYSRWRIRDSISGLAASHDAATDAVAALIRSAVRHGSTPVGPTIVQRLIGHRGWARTVWLAVTVLLAGLLMAWISVRLIQHLSATPSAVAILPGPLLTLALAGTAVQAVGSVEPPESPEATRKLPVGLLGAAMVCSSTWIMLWLVFTTATAPWAAFACGAALVTSVTAGMLAAARPGASPATVPAGVPIPRGLRVQRRCTQRRLRQHIRKWNLAAHQYGVTIAASDEATYALACILSGDADPPLEGIDPFDILILTALRKYHPAPLTASLNVPPLAAYTS